MTRFAMDQLAQCLSSYKQSAWDRFDEDLPHYYMAELKGGSSEVVDRNDARLLGDIVVDRFHMDCQH